MLALTGASGTMLMTSANTTLQLEAPDHLRGRVVSVYLLLMAGSTPIGAFLTGFLSQLTSVQWAILIEAILCGVGVIGAEQYRRVKSGSVGELSTDVEEPTLVR
jgi:MFS family permease